MADETAKRIAELIRPLRVKPGAKVNLARDFNPDYKAGFVKKKGWQAATADRHRAAGRLQRRLAARDTYGVLVCRPGVEAGAARQALAGRR